MLCAAGGRGDRALNVAPLGLAGPQLRFAAPNRSQTCRPQVRKVAEDNGVDVSGQIQELEQRATQVHPPFPALVVPAPGRLL